MAKEKVKLEWTEVGEFNKIAESLVQKYPEKYSQIETKLIICYAITNMGRSKKSKKWYTVKAAGEPECFTNTKNVFVTFYQSDWDSRTEEQKIAFVNEVLWRIDTSVEPYKIRPYDFQATSLMVRTLGPDWEEKESIPNLLTDKVNFRE